MKQPEKDFQQVASEIPWSSILIPLALALTVLGLLIILSALIIAIVKN